MNILAGKYKGHKVESLPGSIYRPTTSRIRKSIFDILGDLSGYTVLDLFAGSGILGFESASRGAAEVTSVDINWQIIKLLKKNSSKFRGADFQIIRADAFSFLKSAGTYDLIFADPPYGRIDLVTLSAACCEHLKDKGVFILESALDDEIPTGYYREKIYGNTRITFWESLG